MKLYLIRGGKHSKVSSLFFLNSQMKEKLFSSIEYLQKKPSLVDDKGPKSPFNIKLHWKNKILEGEESFFFKDGKRILKDKKRCGVYVFTTTVASPTFLAKM